MNRFCKAMSHLNSTQIDEKIKFLDKQLKKTGIVLEAGPTMGTANIYQTFRYDFTPGLPEIEGYVPDSTGFSDGTSTQDANGGDESDSNTWENGWNNISDMQNSNDLNGETNRNISFTPDLSGWTPAAQSNKSSENPIGSGFGGVATWSISSGIGGGRTIGTLTAGNTYVGMVVPDNIFSTYNYPGYPRTNIVYAFYSDSEYAAAKNIADAYEDNKLKGSVTRKVWVPYHSATSHDGPTYDEYTGAKKTTTITDYDGNSVTKQWKLKSIMILNGARQNYISQTKRLPSSSTTLLTQHSLDDPSFYAGNPNKFMDFLKDALGIGEKALDWLTDKAQEVAGGLPYTKDDDPFGADDRGDDWEDDSDIPGDFPFDFAGAGGSPGQKYTDPNSGKKFSPNTLPKGWKPGDPIPTKLAMNTQSARDMIIRGQVPMISPGQAREILNNPPKGHEWDIDTESILRRLMVQSDSDTQIASDSGGTYNKFGEFVPNLKVGDNQQIAWGGGKSKEEKALEKKFNYWNNTAKYNNKQKGDNAAAMIQMGMGMPVDSFTQTFGITPTEWKNPANWLPDGKPNPDGPAWNKYKKKNENYEQQGELISEGWESPKYTYVDKDQQKRWFKEKDIQPVYPKKAPPKMVKGWHPKFIVKLDTPIPVIEVTKKNLQRSHTFKPDEVEELMQLVKNLNDYIKRNPDHLAYARVRYPKHDTRLAALNYKLDMQLAAADEYVETRFPENERLFDRLMKRTKESIKLTDPKTYENDNGKLITFNKLARIGNDYQPRKIKVKKKPKMSQDKLFLLPDRKKKDDILKDKMAVLDKEIQKTMPDM